ncbi:MAG TPA: RNA-guided endonuclease TnpB family protein [Ktedonobacterales bacterium]|jgi:putative transposase
MLVPRAYKTELALTNLQVTACKQHAGAARFSYNWGLARRQEEYKATKRSLNAIDLHKELNTLKKTEYPWLYATSKCAPQEALRNLDSAFSHFFRRCQLKKTGRLRGKVGYPRPKSKKRGLGSFRLTGSIVIFPKAIQLPRLGRLRLKEKDYLPTSGVKILSATVSEQAGHWYVSVQVEQEQTVPANAGPVVGVDLGIKSLATLSDGTMIPNPRHLKRRLKKLKRFHRAVSRKVKGSKNRRKAANRLAKLYRNVANQRQNTLHHLTTHLAKTKQVIVIEDLNVSGMLKNHYLAQSIADVGFYEFKRQLLYKAAWYGSIVLLASRWEPSSKTCSGCGWVDETLTLADRTFHCQACGLVLDRDLNAAINLAKLAGSLSDSLNACGEERSGTPRKSRVKLPSKRGPRARKKQEQESSYASA